jgi:serine/threonine-protein kinase
MTVTAVVADDSTLLRAGIVLLLREEGIAVLGEAGDANGLLDLVTRHRPDVAIVDIRMPPTFRTEGLDAAAAIRAHHPGIGILLLSQYVETENAIELLAGGAAGIGYLLKDRVADIDNFIDAVRRVAAGNSAIDPDVISHLLGRPHRGHQPLDDLTIREREVLRLMAEGRSNRSIAATLYLGERTVEAYISNIFHKLALATQPDDHRRVLAVIAYLRAGNTNPGDNSTPTH